MRKSCFVVTGLLCVTAFVGILAACPFGGDIEAWRQKAARENGKNNTPGAGSNQTPAVGDYTIAGTGTFTYNGTSRTVTVTPKSGKSPGAVTVYYNGTATAPVNAGTYTVTFNVAAATGWNAIIGHAAGTLVINKAAGAAVSAPTAASVTANSVTLNAVTAPANGQTVEYARNGSNIAPASGWQTGTIFSGLSAGTTYYFFARSAGNGNYNAGTASSGTAIATVAAVPTVVNIAAIQGVTAPAAGRTPVTAITETAQYTGTVSWSPAVTGTFAVSTTYTATITLTAKTGFTLQGVAANFFTVAGTTSRSNPANSGIVTAAFPATGAQASLVEMVPVPGGSFQLGKDLGTAATGDVTPLSNVTISGFYMGKYEVTQGQYQAVMGSNPASGYGAGDNYPVYYVSWYDALVFCNKLSRMEGLTPAYSISGSTNPDDWGSAPTSSNSTWNAVTVVSGSTGYRLPTEAQWEYAAKGGNPQAAGWVGYTYAGSDNPAEVAWYNSNGGSTSKVVGTKAPNGLGIYDMSGNVWEWCWDWYGSYSSADKTDSTGASSGSNRVARGGNWHYSAEFVRSADRGSINPNYRSYLIGFRLARP